MGSCCSFNRRLSGESQTEFGPESGSPPTPVSGLRPNPESESPAHRGSQTAPASNPDSGSWYSPDGSYSCGGSWSHSFDRDGLYYIELESIVYCHDEKTAGSRRQQFQVDLFTRSVISSGGRVVQVRIVRFAEIHNFGRGDDLLRSICVPSHVQELAEESFCTCRTLRMVTFEFGSKLLSIERRAFVDCSSLSTICIPASVQQIGGDCFGDCQSLSEVTFERGSRLYCIETQAFRDCPLLSSICIPSSVVQLGDKCFCRCRSLCTVRFEPGSRLSKCGGQVFLSCGSLRSIYIPASLETLLEPYRSILKVTGSEVVVSSGGAKPGEKN
jgi:hypothetical protein